LDMRNRRIPPASKSGERQLPGCTLVGVAAGISCLAVHSSGGCRDQLPGCALVRRVDARISCLAVHSSCLAAHSSGGYQGACPLLAVSLHQGITHERDPRLAGGQLKQAAEAPCYQRQGIHQDETLGGGDVVGDGGDEMLSRWECMHLRSCSCSWYWNSSSSFTLCVISALPSPLNAVTAAHVRCRAEPSTE